MLDQTLAIIRNTFFESIRQHIMLVVLVAATILLVLSNPLAGFTMDDDQRMLVDIGLATVFLAGALLAALIATSVLTREIENKTALTVVSKPVGRPLFVLGKFIGVAAAMSLATLYMGLVFMLVEMHSVMQTARDSYHLPAITFGVGAVAVGTGVAVWCNYFYGKVFASTVLCVTTPLLALAYLLALMFRHDFTTQPMATAFEPHLWLALMALTVAILVLTAVAIAASSRFGQVMTLAVTLGIFILGMLSDWIFGRRLAAMQEIWTRRATELDLTHIEERTRTITLISGEVSEPIIEEVVVSQTPLILMAQGWELPIYALFKVLYSLVPNFQVMLLIDALTQGHRIPLSYVWGAAAYGGACIVGALGLAVILFQRREVG